MQYWRHVRILLMVLWSGGFSMAAQLPTQSAKTVHYDMTVAMQADSFMLTGQEQVTWRNQTEGTASELFWHVYNNAWAGRNSVWMVEARGFEDDKMPRAWGETQITHLALADGTELSWSWVPQEKAPDDRTVMRVELPKPVGPGEEVSVQLNFTALLPPAYRRSGWGESGYIHAVQWYPKLGVFERTADGFAWNCQPYHYLSEFYADYGDYTLNLTLPGEYAGHLAATGTIETETANADGTVTMTMHAEDVHDYAWTADPKAIFETRRFDAADWRDEAEERKVADALNRTLEDIRPRDVQMILLLQPEHEEYRERYFDAVAKSLYYFGLWYGEYPYDTITCVDPANDARATGGMEYPRLFTGGVSRGNHERTLSPEGVTVHEFGHQFWYGLVGNDEFHHAWLDEGFNTFSTNRILAKAWPLELQTYSVFGTQYPGRAPLSMPSFGKFDARAWLTLQHAEIPETPWSAYASFALTHRTSVEGWLQEIPAASYLPEVSQSRTLALLNAHNADWGQPLSTPTWDMVSNQLRRTNAYNRPALTLETMSRLMGEDRWIRLMREWHETQRYQHPKPAEFKAVLLKHGEGVGVDWNAFWQQAYHGNQRMDFKLERVTNRLVVEDPRALEEKDGLADATWKVRVEVRRTGDFQVPVDIDILFADGITQRYTWDGTDPVWVHEVAASTAKVVRVMVDPEHKLLLEKNALDNTWTMDEEESRSWNLSVHAMIWAQQVLHYYGGRG